VTPLLAIGLVLPVALFGASVATVPGTSLHTLARSLLLMWAIVAWGVCVFAGIRKRAYVERAWRESGEPASKWLFWVPPPTDELRRLNGIFSRTAVVHVLSVVLTGIAWINLP